VGVAIDFDGDLLAGVARVGKSKFSLQFVAAATKIGQGAVRKSLPVFAATQIFSRECFGMNFILGRSGHAKSFRHKFVATKTGKLFRLSSALHSGCSIQHSKQKTPNKSQALPKFVQLPGVKRSMKANLGPCGVVLIASGSTAAR
jgi:hypothetical protein